MFLFQQFYKIRQFCDQHIEVMLNEITELLLQNYYVQNYYRITDLIESYVYYEFVYEFIFLRVIFETFIRKFYAVIVLYLSGIYLFICLFIFFIYQIFIINIFIKDLSGYVSDNFLYIFKFKLYSLQKGTK